MTNRIPVEVRPAIDPAGRPGVLLQFSHGWIVLPPGEAERLARMIIETAQEVRISGPLPDD